MPKKVLIVHDMFLYRGGGERLVLLMARALDADIVTGFYDAGCYDPESLGVPRSRIVSLLERPPRSSSLRKLLLARAFRRDTTMIRDYDCVIFSGDCLSALAQLQPAQRSIYYCHTPPRYLFDQYEAYMSKIRPLLRPLYRAAFAWFRRAYLRDIARIDKILVNSRTIEKRLKEHTGADSSIVYPCVDTEFFAPAPVVSSGESYFLSYARLASIKRVDRIVEAFARMPERKLVLVHGKHDPQREEILARVRTLPNIETRESPADEELRDLIRGATAVIYVPLAEDFGMTPLEAMACGTSVIAAADGGLLETVVDGSTGYFVSAEARVEEIMEAAEKIDSAPDTRDACVARANEFSYRRFAERMRAALE
jgi:glycosyltransferase involved in cell wall biosynthesis